MAGDMSKTAKQVREEWRIAGVSMSQWARKHGYKVSSVNAVLRGQHKGLYGNSKRIRQALGLKEADA